MKQQTSTPRPRSFICIILSYGLQIFLCVSTLLCYFIQTSNFAAAQGSANILRLHNLFSLLVDVVIIFTLTATSASYGSANPSSKSTYFWVLICEIGIRVLLSFFTLTGSEYNVYEAILEFKENGERVPNLLVMCHFKRKLEKYASIIVTSVGILLGKIILDSKVWEKNAHQHRNDLKEE